METVNSIASGVSKAIWGEPKPTDTTNKEPVSGELGNVKAGEPYDKGNTETTSEPKSLTKSTSREVASADSTADLPSTAAHTSNMTAPVHTDDKTNAATQAALVNLENGARTGTIGDSAKDGDGLLSAKKVGEGEGVSTGVKADSGLPVSKEPIGVKDASEKSTGPTTNATTTASTSSPVKEATPRKSESSASSKDKDGKQKLSLKEKIKAKLHKH